MRKSVVFFVAVSAIILNSCKKDIEIPAYLHIKQPAFNAVAGQGTSLHNISYVGVYINDNLEGIYEVPVTFPILKKGNFKVQVRPFIKRLARSGVHNYTMVAGYEEDVTLVEKLTDTVSPVFAYESNVKFLWLEDFNLGTSSLNRTQGNVDTLLVTKSRGPGVDSTFYGYIDLGGISNPFIKLETQDEFTFPTDGRDLYLEFHYKCNIPFTVGLVERGPTQITSLPSVTPFETSGEWRKGYVYLNDELIFAPAGAKYRIFIGALNEDPSIPGEIFLDNFKLLYRE
ncbi:MAG TPA: hypothetical protein VEC12_07435 [Bacteroidia bacterium]|nr:hypothetical protein [Bacteroidia bacterium]